MHRVQFSLSLSLSVSAPKFSTCVVNRNHAIGSKCVVFVVYSTSNESTYWGCWQCLLKPLHLKYKDITYFTVFTCFFQLCVLYAQVNTLRYSFRLRPIYVPYQNSWVRTWHKITTTFSATTRHFQMSCQKLTVVNTNILNVILYNIFDFEIIKAPYFHYYIFVRNCYYLI
jgi:hypothetical protein